MRIIAATAYAFNEKILMVFEAGMDDYLAKPI
jgi:CheY-like chemotaxis protein